MVDFLKCNPFSALPDFISAILKIQEIPSTNLINRANEKAIFVLDNSVKEMNNLARIGSLPSRHCVHCFRIEIARKSKIIFVFVRKQKKRSSRHPRELRSKMFFEFVEERPVKVREQVGAVSGHALLAESGDAFRGGHAVQFRAAVVLFDTVETVFALLESLRLEKTLQADDGSHLVKPDPRLGLQLVSIN